MIQKANELKDEGSPIKFIENVGDSFYTDRSSFLDIKINGGVDSINDHKWNSLWSNVYLNDSLKNVPWFSVLGNHDWRRNPKAQIEYGKVEGWPNNVWKMPNFQWDTWIDLPNEYCKGMAECEPKAALIHIDTNYFFHGFKWKSPLMFAQFKRLGWTKDEVIGVKLRDYLEETLKRYKKAAYIFVTGRM